MNIKNEESILNSRHKIDEFSSTEPEQQLKELWSQYISCLDIHGMNESAKALRNKYFSLYHSYRRDKNWRDLISSN